MDARQTKGATGALSPEEDGSTLLHHDDNDDDNDQEHVAPAFRVYKRRFFGLAQLVFLNIIISWDWLTFAPVSGLAAEWFHVSESAINWMSIGILLAFTAATPLVVYLLNKGGPSLAIRTASVFVLIGNWIRYAGTKSGKGHFGVAMFGQIVIGIAQPFVLSVPTRYSSLWFSDEGRVSATAVASLANPLGGALGQLIGPFWATEASQIPSMVLWTSIISSIVAGAGLFTPTAPPTPPSAIAAEEKLDIRHALQELPRNIVFWLGLVPFVVYVGFFNATSSLLNQIFEPYGFSSDEAGIAGALLILVGLVVAAIVSPIVDRTKRFLPTIWILVPLVAASYITLIFMPQTRGLAGSYIVCSILGATSFSLLPCALEYLALSTHPVSPEISSIICWSSSQLLGAIFIVIMDALKGTWVGQPADNMYSALVFQACIACVAVPFPLMIGRWKLTSRAPPSGASTVS